MRGGKPESLLGAVGEHLLALRRGRRLRVGVELDRDRGLGELHRGHVHQVAHSTSFWPLLSTTYIVWPGVWPVAARTDAREQLVAPSNGLNLPAAMYGLIDAIAPLKKSLASFGAASRFAWLEPVVGVALVGAHDRVRERELVAGHEPADVVAVHVRDVDLVDLLRLVAGRLEIVDEVAERRAEQIAGAGVDQDQLAPVLTR